ncbi:MAG: metal-dependent transcriptional regulator [Chloroflexi bacterium]|nr:metal-dependent transcriptional regulator [Chloroflexota bacterium]
MRENLTQSIEDYLKAVYELSSRGARATTTDLAHFLNVTPASVTGMIKKLSATEPPLVEYRKHRGVMLTNAGEKVALETIRHHRLLELFLHQILDYPWDEVHDEADRLEHVISEKFERAIASALGNPDHDPHGDPIPGYDLSLPEATDTLLSELRPPQRGVVTRVRDTDPELLRYLHDLGVVPEAEVKILSYSEFDGNLEITVTGGKKVVLGPRITGQIHIHLKS